MEAAAIGRVTFVGRELSLVSIYSGLPQARRAALWTFPPSIISSGGVLRVAARVSAVREYLMELMSGLFSVREWATCLFAALSMPGSIVTECDY